jgi:hypothetical protein
MIFSAYTAFVDKIMTINNVTIIVIHNQNIFAGGQELLLIYIDKKKKGIFGASSGSTAISSFFSSFSLVPLGCCGSWLLILSFLPSIFGSTLSVILIRYSVVLSYIGLTIVFGFAAISAIKLRRELKQGEQQEYECFQNSGN